MANKSRRLKYEWFCNKTGESSQWELPCPCNKTCVHLTKVSPGRGIFGKTKRYIFDKYGNKCLKCGTKKLLTIDHVIPISKGGTNDSDNLQPLCQRCNSEKGNKSCADYR